MAIYGISLFADVHARRFIEATFISAYRWDVHRPSGQYIRIGIGRGTQMGGFMATRRSYIGCLFVPFYVRTADRTSKRLVPGPNPPRIFYITPEKLKHSGLVTRILNKIAEDGELARFVIDESHLVIKWGRDFRDAVGCL